MKIIQWSRVVPCGQTDGQMKRQRDGRSVRERERQTERHEGLIVAFCDFVKVPKGVAGALTNESLNQINLLHT